MLKEIILKTYICPICKIAYNGEYLKENFGKRNCPNLNCKTTIPNLVEIDELLINVIYEMWQNKIHTKFSCSGHYLSKEIYHYPYITFDKDPKIENILRNINIMFDNFLDVESSPNFTCARPKFKTRKLSHIEFLKIQSKFIKCMYKLMNVVIYNSELNNRD